MEGLKEGGEEFESVGFRLGLGEKFEKVRFFGDGFN